MQGQGKTERTEWAHVWRQRRTTEHVGTRPGPCIMLCHPCHIATGSLAKGSALGIWAPSRPRLRSVRCAACAAFSAVGLGPIHQPTHHSRQRNTLSRPNAPAQPASVHRVSPTPPLPPSPRPPEMLCTALPRTCTCCSVRPMRSPSARRCSSDGNALTARWCTTRHGSRPRERRNQSEFVHTRRATAHPHAPMRAHHAAQHAAPAVGPLRTALGTLRI